MNLLVTDRKRLKKNAAIRGVHAKAMSAPTYFAWALTLILTELLHGRRAGFFTPRDST